MNVRVQAVWGMATVAAESGIPKVERLTIMRGTRVKINCEMR